MPDEAEMTEQAETTELPETMETTKFLETVAWISEVAPELVDVLRNTKQPTANIGQDCIRKHTKN